MTNLAKIKRLYLWKTRICKTFWTTLVCHNDTGSSQKLYKWHLLLT